MPQKNLKLDYVEFPATNIVATKEFYGALFGWAFVDYGPDYVAFTHESAGIDGGFTTQSPVKDNGVLIVLYADDLEAMLIEVQNAGGEIVQDIFSFPGGKRFHFKDPNGNELAIWTTISEE